MSTETPVSIPEMVSGASLRELADRISGASSALYVLVHADVEDKTAQEAGTEAICGLIDSLAVELQELAHLGAES